MATSNPSRSRPAKAKAAKAKPAKAKSAPQKSTGPNSAKKAAPKRKAAAPKDPLKAAKRKLRTYALSFPETTEEFPWGEAVYKVRGKVFIFTGTDDDLLSLSVKLPRSREFALDRPFAESTGYGLGKSGWITAIFERGDAIPFDYLEAWIRESYIAVAPKRLSQTLG